MPESRSTRLGGTRSVVFPCYKLNSIDCIATVKTPSKFAVLAKSPVLARMVTRSRGGQVNPPSSLRVELPISIGPSTGPNPKNSVACFAVLSFQPNIPAVIRILLPSDAMVKHWRERKAFQISTSVASCS